MVVVTTVPAEEEEEEVEAVVEGREAVADAMGTLEEEGEDPEADVVDEVIADHDSQSSYESARKLHFCQ